MKYIFAVVFSTPLWFECAFHPPWHEFSIAGNVLYKSDSTSVSDTLFLERDLLKGGFQEYSIHSENIIDTIVGGKYFYSIQTYAEKDEVIDKFENIQIRIVVKSNKLFDFDTIFSGRDFKFIEKSGTTRYYTAPDIFLSK